MSKSLTAMSILPWQQPTLPDGPERAHHPPTRRNLCFDWKVFVGAGDVTPPSHCLEPLHLTVSHLWSLICFSAHVCCRWLQTYESSLISPSPSPHFPSSATLPSSGRADVDDGMGRSCIPRDYPLIPAWIHPRNPQLLLRLMERCILLSYRTKGWRVSSAQLSPPIMEKVSFIVRHHLHCSWQGIP